MNSNKKDVVTVEKIFEEFQLSIENDSASKITCPSCFANLYETTKQTGVESIHGKKCYRCGILVCSECKSVLGSLEHIRKHKEEVILKQKDSESKEQLSNIEKTFKKMEDQLLNSSSDRMHYFITIANSLRYLYFIKESISRQKSSTLTYENLIKFTNKIEENIRVLLTPEYFDEKISEYKEKTGDTSSFKNLILLVRSILKGYLKESGRIISEASFEANYCTRKMILTTTTDNIFSKKRSNSFEEFPETKKNKIEIVSTTPVSQIKILLNETQTQLNLMQTRLFEINKIVDGSSCK